MASPTLFCNNCGTQNQASDDYCVTCRQPLRKNVSVPTVAVPTPRSTSVPTTTMPTTPPAPMPTGLLSPHTLLRQRYMILQSVGKGGMGTVYIAHDTSLGNRLVAIKEMSPGNLPSQEMQSAVASFKREAHMLAGLNHPNLPSIHDHFEEAGCWYLVMSFIPGETLEDYVLRSPGQRLPLEEVLQIAQQLCDVLDYLHTCQPPIIFRDLKPSNIMYNAKGHIYLIDFGIARHFKPGQAKDTASYGSPGYSPPEQYGEAQTSARSDIYSMGVTLYYLLSGYKPILAPFRLPPLQSLVPTLPPRLVTLITQMIELDDSKRPANIKVVRQELQQVTTPASAPPPKPVKGSSVLSIIGMIIGILVALSGTGEIIFLSPSNDPNINYTAYGAALLFLGLLILFIARIRKISHPLSNFRRAEAVIGILVGGAGIAFGIWILVAQTGHDFMSYQNIPILLIIESIVIMFIAWFTHFRKSRVS